MINFGLYRLSLIYLEDGDWIRNGNNITNNPKEITFDNVDRDLNLIKQSSEMLPQVIIGWGGRGDLPSVNPKDLAIILSGLANVHFPNSGATLEIMNRKTRQPRNITRGR